MQLKAKVRNLALKNHIPAQAVLQNFMLERLVDSLISVQPLLPDQAPRNSSVTRMSSSECVQMSAWSAPSIMVS
jgi:hypothetical protein